MARTSSIGTVKTEVARQRAGTMLKRGERRPERDRGEPEPLPEHMGPAGEMAPAPSVETQPSALPGSRGLPPSRVGTEPDMEHSELPAPSPRAKDRAASPWGLVFTLILIAIVASLIVYSAG